jgi:hypothetical protein
MLFAAAHSRLTITSKERSAERSHFYLDDVEVDAYCTQIPCRNSISSSHAEGNVG